MIQLAFGDQSLSRTQVFQWHARFKTGRTSVDDDVHTGRRTSCTTPETVARIQELVRQDRRRTIRDIAEEVGIGYGTCQRVLTKELGMHCSKNGRDGDTDVYMREGTTSRVMAADRPYGELYVLYSASTEYFGYHHKNTLQYIVCEID
jgi:hypothetical protein